MFQKGGKNQEVKIRTLKTALGFGHYNLSHFVVRFYSFFPEIRTLVFNVTLTSYTCGNSNYINDIHGQALGSVRLRISLGVDNILILKFGPFETCVCSWCGQAANGRQWNFFDH